MNTQTQYDAIVVGSGISGGWAAKELCEKGLNVLLLEKGQNIEHIIDYKTEHLGPWEFPFAGKAKRVLYQSEYSVQQDCYIFDETTRHYFNNDKDYPYLLDKEKPFQWLRANGLGGRSLIWGRQTYRWNEQDFLANGKDRHGVDWPIRYQDIEPWYEYVEKFIGVSGQSEGLAQLPDGVFQKPMEMHRLEKTIKGRLEKYRPELTMTIGRAAILTEALNGRAPCHYCGPCYRGCSTGSYFSSQSSTLPAAKATGRLTIRTNRAVEKLKYNDETGRISEVQVIDVDSKEKLTFSSRMVFLCASTIASTQILLNSRSKSFPHGLANSSGALGRYLMDHVKIEPTYGIFVDHLDRYYQGNRPNGCYIPRFRNWQKQDEDADFLRGYGMQALTLRMDWTMQFNQKSFGAALKDKLSKPGYWTWILVPFGECLPNKDNRMMLDEHKTDSLGIPQVKFDVTFGENERKMAADVAKQTASIMRAAGSVFYEANDSISPPGKAIHEMGTARMGKDPATSVLNGWNQAHDVANLFVTDGSCMASSSCVNPSLTYMALTARACDYAVKEFKAGRL